MKKIDVIYIDLNDVDINNLFYSEFLNDKDRKNFEKYRHPEVKKEKIASLYLKKKYIKNYYIDENGKPMAEDKYFNISHSHGLIVLIVDEVPVGIDVELIRKYDDGLKNFISSEEEKEFIKDNQSFFEVWTNKEALVKAAGLGIKEDIKTIPSLPINGTREYKRDFYLNRTIRYNNYIISTSRHSKEEYDINLVGD